MDYISPEELRGEPLDQRSDLFSLLGIVLAELLNGFHPFRRTESEDTSEAILNGAPNLSGDLPEGLRSSSGVLLAKSIELRYPSIAEVQADLMRLGSDPLAPHVASVVTEIPLIGRDQEFAELKRLLNEALAGRGSMVMIGASPESGRHTLHATFLKRGSTGVPRD